MAGQVGVAGRSRAWTLFCQGITVGYGAISTGLKPVGDRVTCSPGASSLNHGRLVVGRDGGGGGGRGDGDAL